MTIGFFVLGLDDNTILSDSHLVVASPRGRSQMRDLPGLKDQSALLREVVACENLLARRGDIDGVLFDKVGRTPVRKAKNA